MSDYSNPEWETTGRVHDWRNYISESLREIWDTFSEDQKRIIAQNAAQQADAEEWD